MIISPILLPPAKSQICAVLRALLTTNGVSERQFVFNGFRSRLSNLRNDYNLPIQVRDIEFTNQFGRDSAYHEHYLLPEHKEQAIDLYLKLNK